VPRHLLASEQNEALDVDEILVVLLTTVGETFTGRRGTEAVEREQEALIDTSRTREPMQRRSGPTLRSERYVEVVGRVRTGVRAARQSRHNEGQPDAGAVR
jgi:hypothetical protein